MKTHFKMLYASIFFISTFIIRPACQCNTEITAEKVALLDKITPCRHFFDDKLDTCMNSLEKEAFTKQFLLLDLTCKQLAELDLNENYSFMEIYRKNKIKLAEMRKANRARLKK